MLPKQSTASQGSPAREFESRLPLQTNISPRLPDPLPRRRRPGVRPRTESSTAPEPEPPTPWLPVRRSLYTSVVPEQEWARRVFREGDEQGILELLTAAYGHWPGVDIDVEPLSHLRWKLDSDPFVMQYHCLRVAGKGVSVPMAMTPPKSRYWASSA